MGGGGSASPPPPPPPSSYTPAARGFYNSSRSVHVLFHVISIEHTKCNDLRVIRGEFCCLRENFWRKIVKVSIGVNPWFVRRSYLSVSELQSNVIFKTIWQCNIGHVYTGWRGWLATPLPLFQAMPMHFPGAYETRNYWGG